MADRLLALRARIHMAWPANDERHAVSALEDVGLRTAKDMTGAMAQLLQLGKVDERRATVVAGNNQERVVSQTIVVERLEELAQAMVVLEDKVGVVIEAALSLPILGRRDRRVGRSEREV